MNKYQEDLDKLFNFATHNDNGQKGVNDYVLEELRQSKLNLEELVDKATPKKVVVNLKLRNWVYRCPSCNGSVEHEYCGRCSQALDWTKND